MNDSGYTREDVEKILGKPGTIVAYRKDGRPIYNVAGGSINFEGGDDDDDKGRTVTDDEDDDDDDDDDSEEETWQGPTKEQWEKLLADKKKADSESAARKRLLREAGINPKDGSPLKVARKLTALDEPEDDSDDDLDADPKANTKRTVDTSEDAKTIQKRLQREMERNLLDAEADVRKEERDRSRALMSAIPEALNTEGWSGKALPRILKLLDLDSLEVDEDGVAGLDEQVTELKRDFPEFFKRQRMKDAADKVADRRTAGGGSKRTSPAKQDGNWAENIARALHGEG